MWLHKYCSVASLSLEDVPSYARKDCTRTSTDSTRATYWGGAGTYYMSQPVLFGRVCISVSFLVFGRVFGLFDAGSSRPRYFSGETPRLAMAAPTAHQRTGAAVLSPHSPAFGPCGPIRLRLAIRPDGAPNKLPESATAPFGHYSYTSLAPAVADHLHTAAGQEATSFVIRVGRLAFAFGLATLA